MLILPIALLLAVAATAFDQGNADDSSFLLNKRDKLKARLQESHILGTSSKCTQPNLHLYEPTLSDDFVWQNFWVLSQSASVGNPQTDAAGNVHQVSMETIKEYGLFQPQSKAESDC